MSRRLGYGDDQRLNDDSYNLALDGGGPLTGLALIEAKKEKPRFVLIEMNWLRRPIDIELMDRISFFKVFPAFREEFKPISLIKAKIAGRLNTAQPTDLPISDLTGDADTPGVPASLKITVPRWGAVDPNSERILKENAETMRNQIESLQRDGVEVAFLFMPMHPDLEKAPAFMMALKILKQYFPEDLFECLYVEDATSYHTVDSIHLTTPSSVRMSLFLRDIIRSNLNIQTLPRSTFRKDSRT